MKIVKKAIYIIAIAIITLIIYATITKAAVTLKVTADTLNLREEASTDSDIIALMSKGESCELIEEAGDWYKVKYKTYTGYVTKEYVQKNEDTDEKQVNSAALETNTDESDSTATNNQTATSDNNSQVTGKAAKQIEVRLLPLIYSSKIGNINKDGLIIIITELNGWSYIQSDSIEGWARSDSIIDKNAADDNQTNDETTNADNNKKDEQIDANDAQAYTEKTMYVNDSFVNLRKEASTSADILMVVELNTKLTVIGESGDWYKVQTSEGEAYVSKKLLSTKQVTSSRGGIMSKQGNTSETSLNSTDTTTTEVSKVTTTSTTTSNTTSSSTKGRQIVAYAQQFLGVPYVYGGASASGFDCSGFTMYVYKHFGISMAHGAQAQSKLGKAVNANKASASSLKQSLQPGDLVFFLDYETMDEIGHCGIYIGDGNFIHASSGTGYCVRINSLLPGEYYNTRYCAARRII